MHRHQRRGTRRVHRHRGPLQPEYIGHATGDHAHRVPGQDVAAVRCLRLVKSWTVLLVSGADEDAGCGVPKR